MKILVLLLSGIGDVLQATPALRVLRRAFPQANITGLVMYNAAAALLKDCPYLDEVVQFDFLKSGHFRSLWFVLRFRRRCFDVCILAYPANRWQYNLISFLIGAKLRIAHRYAIKRFTSLSFLQSKLLPIDFYRHTIDENIKLLEFLGIHERTYDKSVYFPLQRENELFAKKFFRRHRIRGRAIGFHPGSSELSGMIYKRWPKERFAALCDKVTREFGARVLLFGGRGEELLKRFIFDHMRSKPVIVPETSLWNTGALIKACDLFVCNDTALMHIAAAVGTNVIVVEGPTNHYKTAPLKRSTVVAKDLDCRPCYQIGEVLHCKYRGGSYDCLNSVTVDDVLHAIREMLQ